ncbi:hypothetical protein LguiA_026928 [Lonicera macranthoides]
MANLINGIREVWDQNLDQEILLMEFAMRRYTMISFDTEYPGFLRYTPRDASELKIYDNLKFNVGRLNPIQFGFTLFDRTGNVGGTWQINFSDFDTEINTNDCDASTSLSLTKRKSGIDFVKQRREGVLSRSFAHKFGEALNGSFDARKITFQESSIPIPCPFHSQNSNQTSPKRHANLEWVTFHGLYDFGYLTKVIAGYKHLPASIATEMLLPDSLQGFQLMIGGLFGRIYDIKYMARFCGGLQGGELGLQKLANILKVGRTGSAHQAGSDSLLTVRVYLDMKQLYNLDEKVYEGFLYGVGGRVMRRDISRQFSLRFGWPLSLVPPPLYGLVKISNTQRPVVVHCVPRPVFQTPTFPLFIQSSVGL